MKEIESKTTGARERNVTGERERETEKETRGRHHRREREMSRAGNLAMWQNGLTWLDDDEDQDSDTDSKLSGSAIVDSVM